MITEAAQAARFRSLAAESGEVTHRSLALPSGVPRCRNGLGRVGHDHFRGTDRGIGGCLVGWWWWWCWVVVVEPVTALCCIVGACLRGCCLLAAAAGAACLLQATRSRAVPLCRVLRDACRRCRAVTQLLLCPFLTRLPLHCRRRIWWCLCLW